MEQRNYTNKKSSEHNKNDFGYKRINLVLPVQRSRFSAIYNVYNDLYLGLKKIGFDSEIILIKTFENYSKFPYFNVKEVNIKDLNDILLLNEQFSLTVDDFEIMNYFFKNNIRIKNLLIWALYFYGHKFIFERYRELWKENFSIPYYINLIDYIPFYILRRKAKFYYRALSNNKTVAGSLWTDLLLERVYNIFTEGILYIPVEYEFYDVNEYSKENRALIFFGEKDDVDLICLKRTIDTLREANPKLDFDYFGDEEVGLIFNKKFNENIKYLGKLDRKDLSKEYSKHLVTITPIYNGNFEMVPIESLLSGTPVITYIQPFIEVTGQSVLIANINNKKEIKRKFNYWFSNDLSRDLKIIKGKILDVMDNAKVARDLLNYLE